MTKNSKNDSVTDLVFDNIYKRIKTGTIKSGEILSERSIANELNVSRTPVREAFIRLERFGLVEMEKHRGVKVITFSTERVKQLYQVREVLEGLAARILAEQADTEVIEKLEMLIDKAEQAASEQDIEKLSNINTQFHTEIAKSTGNSYLISTMEKLQSHIGICMARSLSSLGRPLENIAEHRQIVKAIKLKDADFAEAVTRYHVRRSLNNVLKRLEDNND